MLTFLLLVVGLILLLLCGLAIIFASPVIILLLVGLAVDGLVIALIFGRGKKQKEKGGST
jgi:hypothetical protein